MGNEVIDWIKELWLEVKGLPSDFKEWVNRVNAKEKKRLTNEMNRIKIRIREEIKLINKASNVKKENKPIVAKREEIVIKCGNNLFTNLLLLYLCLLNTLVVVGLLSFLVGVSNELPVDRLSPYFDGFISFMERFDDMNGANRILGSISTLPEMPYDQLGEPINPLSEAVMTGNITDYLVKEVEDGTK